MIAKNIVLILEGIMKRANYSRKECIRKNLIEFCSLKEGKYHGS